MESNISSKGGKMKKIVSFTLIYLLALPLLFSSKTFALAPALISSWAPGINYWADCREHEAYQTFIAEDATIDAIGLYVYVNPTLQNPSQQAKIKVTIYNISSIWQYGEVVSVQKAINNDNTWKIIDIPDTRITPGNYAIGVKTINNKNNATWAGSTGDEFILGTAIYDDEVVPDTDLRFTLYGTYLGGINQDSQNGTGNNSSEEQVTPSDAPSTTPAQSPTTNPTTTPSTTTGSTNANINTRSTGSSTRTTAGSPNTGSSDTSAQPPGDLTQVNKSTTTLQPMTTEELKEIMAFIREQQERTKPKGIFGLGGIVGNILTPRNTIIAGSLFIIFLISLIIILILKSNRKKLEGKNKTSASQQGKE